MGPHLHSLLVFTIITRLIMTVGNGGSTVVKVLCYKSEGRWFEFADPCGRAV